MKKIIALSCVSILAAATLAAETNSPETLLGNSEAAFQQLATPLQPAKLFAAIPVKAEIQAIPGSRLSPGRRPEASDPSVLEARAIDSKDVRIPVIRGKRRLLRLTGTVAVQGGGGAPWPSGYATLQVSGPAQLFDDQNRPLVSPVLLSDERTVPVAGFGISALMDPGAYVALYRNGQYVGTIRVHGAILVSGQISGGWAEVSGYGSVSGEGWVLDP